MTTISADISSISGNSSISGSGSSGSRIDAQIAAVEKQITGLQKQLTELQKQVAEDPNSEASKQAKEQAKLIQAQLEMLEARLAQLLEMKTKQAQEAQGKGPEQAGAEVKTPAVTSSLTLGTEVDEFVRSVGAKLRLAEAAAAGGLALLPGMAPLAVRCCARRSASGVLTRLTIYSGIAFIKAGGIHHVQEDSCPH